MTELQAELELLQGLTFPGRAGDLQAAKRWSELASELGRDHERYTAFLSAELGKADRFPDPASFVRKYGQVEGFSKYADAVARVQLLTRAAATVRRTRAAITLGSFERASSEAAARAHEPQLVNSDGEFVPADATSTDEFKPAPTTTSPPPENFRETWPGELPSS